MNVIIIEGFMSFHDCRIVNIIDIFIWIDIKKELCFKRRYHHTAMSLNKYFNQHIWPNHSKYKNNLLNNGLFNSKNMIQIDGSKPVKNVLDEALKFIAMFLP
eukprot:1651_1